MGRLSQGAKFAVVVSRAMKELRFFHFVRDSWEGSWWEGEGEADGSKQN